MHGEPSTEIAVFKVGPAVSVLDHDALQEFLKTALSAEQVRVLVIEIVGDALNVDFSRLPVQGTAFAQISALFEAAQKPILLSLDGIARGAGAGLVLAAHWRLASAKSVIGFPGIRYGLLPECGATQRLPRLVGAQLALEVLLSGRDKLAEASGIFETISKTAPSRAAQRLAKKLCEERAKARPSGQRVEGFKRDSGYASAVSGARKEQEARSSSLMREASLRVVECVEAALLLPFEQGLAFERSAAADLRSVPGSDAWRGLARAARDAAARAVPVVAESGAGVRKLGLALAGGERLARLVPLAASALQQGREVRLFAPDQALIDQAMPLILQSLAALPSRGPQGVLVPSAEAETLQEVDLMLLSAGPRPACQAALAALCAHQAAPGAVLAWTDGGVAGPELPPELEHRRVDFAGLYLPPGGALCGETAALPGNRETSVRRLGRFMQELGWQVVPSAAGGIAPALLRALHQAVQLLRDAGATTEQVAAALAHFGPLAPRLLPSTAVAGAVAHPQILAALLAALVSEGLDLLEQGIAQKPSDIDLVMVAGLAAPGWRGGPMYQAAHLGLPVLLRRIAPLPSFRPQSARLRRARAAGVQLCA